MRTHLSYPGWSISCVSATLWDAWLYAGPKFEAGRVNLLMKRNSACLDSYLKRDWPNSSCFHLSHCDCYACLGSPEFFVALFWLLEWAHLYSSVTILKLSTWLVHPCPQSAYYCYSIWSDESVAYYLAVVPTSTHLNTECEVFSVLQSS